MKKVLALYFSLFLVALIIEYPLFELGNYFSYPICSVTVALFIKGIIADILGALND